MITLYSQPGCSPCKAVARRLDKAGIPFTTIDITIDTNAADLLRDQGFTGTPVIQYSGELHTIVGLSAVIQAHQDAVG